MTKVSRAILIPFYCFVSVSAIFEIEQQWYSRRFSRPPIFTFRQDNFPSCTMFHEPCRGNVLSSQVHRVPLQRPIGLVCELLANPMSRLCNKNNFYFSRSGLEPEDMQVVYNYLVSTLLPAHLETELHGGSMPRNSPSPFTSSHYGK